MDEILAYRVLFTDSTVSAYLAIGRLFGADRTPYETRNLTAVETNPNKQSFQLNPCLLRDIIRNAVRLPTGGVDEEDEMLIALEQYAAHHT